MNSIAIEEQETESATGVIPVTDEIRRNFQIFWGNFPSPVMLVYKNKTIVEANKAGKAIGCPVGTRCLDIGDKKHHAGCRANKALREQDGVRAVGYVPHMKKVMDSYWVPLVGHEDFYVHFGIDITEHAAEHFFPKPQPQQCSGDAAQCGSCPGH